MPRSFRRRILLVDDDESLLATTADVLRQEGYEVETARDGFEALALLRGSVPDLLISDLKMPNMSGFELLSVVRKRFPAIGVIVFSGEFTPLSVPAILADRYVQKGENSAFELLEMVRDVLSQSPLRAQPAKAETAPAWIPRAETSYVVLTCPECLRSFSVANRQVEVDGNVQTDRCIHCGQNVPYRIDSTTAASAGVPPTVLERLQKQVQDRRATIERTKQRIQQSRRSR